jgi:hypothetical protein
LFFQIADINHHFGWPSKQTELEPNVWFTFCVVFDVLRNNVTLQINGNTVFSDIGRHNTSDDRIMFANPIQLGGNLKAPFIGKVIDVNVWNDSHKDVEISDFASCSLSSSYSTHMPIPLQWRNITIDMNNSRNKNFNVTLDEICSYITSTKTILFHKIATFEQAFEITEQLNGEMYLPKNQAEFTKALTLVTSKSSCFTEFWVPIARSETNYTVWLNMSSKTETVTFLPWLLGTI